MTARADVRPEYSYSTVNWLTAVFMGLFHVAAIAAFWFFSWTNVLTALVLHWFAVDSGSASGITGCIPIAATRRPKRSNISWRSAAR